MSVSFMILNKICAHGFISFALSCIVCTDQSQYILNSQSLKAMLVETTGWEYVWRSFAYNGSYEDTTLKGFNDQKYLQEQSLAYSGTVQ